MLGSNSCQFYFNFQECRYQILTEKSILCSPVIQIATLKDLFWDWEDNRIIDGNGIWYIGSAIPLSEACVQNLKSSKYIYSKLNEIRLIHLHPPKNLSFCLRDASNHHDLVLNSHACQPQSISVDWLWLRNRKLGWHTPGFTDIRTHLPCERVEGSNKGTHTVNKTWSVAVLSTTASCAEADKWYSKILRGGGSQSACHDNHCGVFGVCMNWIELT